MKNSILLALLLTLSVASYSQPVIKPLWSLPIMGSVKVHPEINRISNVSREEITIWENGNVNPIYSVSFPYSKGVKVWGAHFSFDRTARYFAYELPNKIAIHDTKSSTDVLTFTNQAKSNVFKFANNNSSLFCYTFNSDSLVLWNTQTNEWIRSFKIPSAKEVKDIIFSNNDSLLVVVSLDSISATNPNSKRIRILSTHKDSVLTTVQNAGAYYLDSDNSLIVAQDSTLLWYSLTNASIFSSLKLSGKPLYFTTSNKFKKVIVGFSMSQTTKSCHIYNRATGEIDSYSISVALSLASESSNVAPWCLTLGEDTLIYRDYDLKIKFFDLHTQQKSQLLVHNLDDSGIYTYLISATKNGHVLINNFSNFSLAEAHIQSKKINNYYQSFFSPQQPVQFNFDASRVIVANKFQLSTFGARNGTRVGTFFSYDPTKIATQSFFNKLAVNPTKPEVAILDNVYKNFSIINTQDAQLKGKFSIPYTSFYVGNFALSPIDNHIALFPNIYSTITGDLLRNCLTFPNGRETSSMVYCSDGNKIILQSEYSYPIILDLTNNSLDTIKVGDIVVQPVRIGDYLLFQNKFLYNINAQKTISFSDSIYNIDVSKNNKYCYQKNDTCFIRSAESNNLLVSFPCSGKLQGFSSSGKFIAVLSLDYNSIYLYDASNTTLLAILQSNRGLEKPQFSPNDSLVLANGSVWDISSLLAINSVPQEIDTNLHMSIAPNPVATELTIKSSCQLPASISLSTAQGVVLQQYHAQSFPFTISTSQFPSGVYSITIKSGNAFVTKQCVVLH